MSIEKYATTDIDKVLDGNMSERLTSLVSQRYLVEMIAMDTGDGENYHVAKIATLEDTEYEVEEAFAVTYTERGQKLGHNQKLYKLPDETACREFLVHVNSLWIFDPAV